VVRECPDGRSDIWTPRELFQRAGWSDGFLVLDWPITAGAQCHSCGHQWEPLVRRARFRRARCPSCGSADLVELEVVSGISASSPWAGRTLAELGLPRGHVHETVSSERESEAETARVHVEVTGDLPGADVRLS